MSLFDEPLESKCEIIKNDKLNKITFFKLKYNKLYLLLRCNRQNAVDEGTMRDHLEPGVSKPGSDVRPDDTQSMAECCEYLPQQNQFIPPIVTYTTHWQWSKPTTYRVHFTDLYKECDL